MNKLLCISVLLTILIVCIACNSNQSKFDKGIVKQPQNDLPQLIFPTFKYNTMEIPDASGKSRAEKAKYCVVREENGASLNNGEEIEILTESICDYIEFFGTNEYVKFKGKLVKIYILSTGSEGWTWKSSIEYSK